jgi:hypothetical protein
MQREDMLELIVTLKNEPAFRKLVKEIVFSSPDPEPKKVRIKRNADQKDWVPPGMVTRDEATVILGVKRSTLRSMVWNGSLEGKGLYVDRESLVNRAMNGKKAVRERLQAWLEKEALERPQEVRTMTVAKGVRRAAVLHNARMAEQPELAFVG